MNLKQVIFVHLKIRINLLEHNTAPTYVITIAKKPSLTALFSKQEVGCVVVERLSNKIANDFNRTNAHYSVAALR